MDGQWPTRVDASDFGLVSTLPNDLAQNPPSILSTISSVHIFYFKYIILPLVDRLLVPDLNSIN